MPGPSSQPIFLPFPHTLRSLFDHQWPLVADEYQRDYAWESGEVSDFIGDLTRLYSKAATGDVDASHFFGALVAIEHRRLPEYDLPEFAIVDGQQRLTTFCLCLAAVLTRAEELQDELLDVDTRAFLLSFIADTETRYVTRSETHKQTLKKRAIPVLRVTQRDQAVFRDIMTREASSGDPELRYSTGLMQQAFETLLEEFVRPLTIGPDPVANVKRLVELTSIVEERSEFVFISTLSRMRATQLFSVLNDRGRSLEQADLLRTHNAMLVENAPQEVRDQVRRAWDEVDGQARLKVDAFLRHHYASVVGQRVASKQLFPQYKAQFHLERDEPLPASEVTAAVKFATDLRGSMRLYSNLSEGVWPFEEATASLWDRDRLRRLVEVLRSDRVLPVLLAAAALGESPLLELVPPLERLEFRALIAGVEQNAMANLYFDVAALLHHRQRDVAGGLYEIGRWVDSWASDEAFARGLSEKLIYGLGQGTAYIKELLTTLNDHWSWLQSGATWPPRPVKTAVWDFGEIHDEHIFPQNPEGGLPGAYELFVHRLGNQTYLGPSDNREVTNLLPTTAAKFEVYLRSEVALTRDVGEHLKRSARWAPTDIEDREEALSRMALEVFALDPAVKGQGGRRRRALFNQRFDLSPRTWLVSSKPGSGYDDRAGAQYHYPARIPNGQQLADGDVLITFRPKTGRRPAEVTGVGLIDRIEFQPDGTRVATFALFVAVPQQISIDQPANGADPRANIRNAMNAVSQEYVDELDRLLGGRLAELRQAAFASREGTADTAS